MDIKVTKIGNEWHARLFNEEGIVIDEYACKLKEDIGWICREMLRWQDKMGNTNDQTQFARIRQVLAPTGKVWKVKDFHLRK